MIDYMMLLILLAHTVKLMRFKVLIIIITTINLSQCLSHHNSMSQECIHACRSTMNVNLCVFPFIVMTITTVKYNYIS